jgi:Thoeris protein ThsB, TIR-like domain
MAWWWGMSEKNPIRIFVTHTFAEHPDYLRVFEYLESSPNFFYVNCSAPQSVPAGGGKEALKEELRKQIKNAEVVIVPAGIYVDNYDWITYQMDAAQAINLPLVVIEPFGGLAELPDKLAERAGEVVGWNERNIVDAVRRQARHEDTARWEVIEFDMPPE